MAVTWHSSPAGGPDAVDRRHDEIFRRLGELVDALEQGRRDEIPRRFQFLGDCVVLRFGEEERAMARCAYPGANVHRAAHARFVRELADLRALYEATGPSFAIAVKTATWVGGWLEGHIDGPDRAFARYVGAAS